MPSKESSHPSSDLFVACRRCAVRSMEVLVVDGRIKSYGEEQIRSIQ
jgi:hypothetical protein